MSGLADRAIVQVPEGTPPLSSAEIAKYKQLVDASWHVVEVDVIARLSRTVMLPNFADAMALASRIAKLADEVDHHPEITVSWGKLKIDVWTHTAKGLAGIDFIFAAKVDQLLAVT